MDTELDFRNTELDFRNVDLTVLPRFIADTRIALLSIEHAINALQAMRSNILADFDYAIAGDTSFSNDAKRKAAKQKLMATDKEYLSVEQNLAVLARQKSEQEIQLGFYRDELRVKLALLGGGDAG
jgi:phosphopantothenate synthetase